MSYQVLARKYRPRSFSQRVGQAHVVQALGNALRVAPWPEAAAALQAAWDGADANLREHIGWALAQRGVAGVGPSP